MSINSAMLAGVSGLKANSSAMSAISDNIANLNTVGYKENRTDFEDLINGKASTGQYDSGGVLATVRQRVTEQGQLTQTSSATDLGIQGSGFFVTTEKATGATAADARTFTRAGSFTVDSQGFLKNASGLYLQGWPADAKGAVTTDPSDLTRLSSIQIDASSDAPNPTGALTVNANLSSQQAVSAQESSYSAGAMAAYDPTAGTGVKPDYSIQTPVYDSKGGEHTLEIDVLKSATANQWHAEVRAVPASDVDGVTNGLLASGVLAFTADGTLDTANTTLPTSLTLGASSAGSGARWASGLGLAAQTVGMSLDGGVTQYALSSATQSVTGDGGPVGSLTNVSVNTKGEVIANFDNGLTRKIAQVAIATFPNADGLSSISGPAYRVSPDSGAYTLKSPGEAGAGAITPSTLESSTVDLSAEFTGLIITQRAYAASAKIITTADQMLQDTIDIKR